MHITFKDFDDLREQMSANYNELNVWSLIAERNLSEEEAVNIVKPRVAKIIANLPEEYSSVMRCSKKQLYSQLLSEDFSYLLDMTPAEFEVKTAFYKHNFVPSYDVKTISPEIIAKDLHQFETFDLIKKPFVSQEVNAELNSLQELKLSKEPAQLSLF